MSRRNSGRSVIGLILEVGLIALVVSLLPKLNFQPSLPATQSEASDDSSWWQAEPAARPTSWSEPIASPAHVEQTLNDASRRLLHGAADFASRAAADLRPPPIESPPEMEPQEWRRY